MKIKKGDNVYILTGKDKGKTGKVTRALPALDRVVVEGVNVTKVVKRARNQGEKSQMVDKNFPIHVSNVRLTDKKQPTTNKKSKSKKVVGSKS